MTRPIISLSVVSSSPEEIRRLRAYLIEKYRERVDGGIIHENPEGFGVTTCIRIYRSPPRKNPDQTKLPTEAQ